MEIKAVLLHIANACDDQHAANIVADYKAQVESVLGEIESQSILNQSVIFEYTNLDKTHLNEGDLLEIKSKYVKATSEYTALKLNKSKALDLKDYLHELAGSLPNPKNFVDSVLKQIEHEDKNADLQYIRRLSQ